jgi:lysophospholipase L1-like esterase
MRRRLLQAAGLAALAAASIAATLLAGEGLLRLAGFSYPMLHQPDELAGLRLRAGAEGWYRDEGEAYVRINSQGWRDLERAPARPEGVVRVAVLGDSFVEAAQVPLEQSFPAVLERKLNRCGAYGGDTVEVLNFGVSSYGTAQQLLTLRHRVWAYDPQQVVLAFLPGNDVLNNSRELEPWRARPFFVLEDGALALDDSFRDDPGFREGSRDARVHARLADLRLHQLFRRARDGAYTGWRDAGLREPGIADQVFAPPAGGPWEQAWQVTEKLIEAMHAEVRARGAAFLAVVLTSGVAVHPDAALRQRYAQTLGVADLSYPERRIARLGAAKGFGVVALGEPLRRHAERTGEFLHGFENTQRGFGHWNAAGHSAAAALVAARLCALPYNAADESHPQAGPRVPQGDRH